MCRRPTQRIFRSPSSTWSSWGERRISACSRRRPARTGGGRSRALATLGIAELAETEYTRISGGQRQLALIARALAQEAPAIVMDEPTASLDFGNQVVVLAEVKRLAAQGLTIVLSTHDPDHVLVVVAQRDHQSRVEETELRVEEEKLVRRELDAVLAQQQRLLRSLEERRQRLELGVGELGRRETRLSRLVDLLEDEGAATLADVAAEELQGALDWPVSGTVVTEFGPRTDPVYGTTLPHNGIEIATLPGAEVRAVYPGRVLFASLFQDLGYTVVIEHSGRVLTLYAGLQRLQVTEGDVLPFQAVVGSASERLYFEVRRGKKAEDPRAWLR